MKDFNSLSGPWIGWSIQDGLRITESIRLTIQKGIISGSGTDKDGEFELQGAYIERGQKVLMTRTYTRTTEPSQEGVGIPYEYVGSWDGSFVSGRWHPRWNQYYGGPFEMWPADATEELRIELQIEVEEEAPLVGAPR
ncbi:MAG: hypothetical protein BGO01_08330 [Armatimonadetes bacterium 55-13]|nr:MAG: hypothetical protein BGO01_08330 [Armatimonadetes bacterium 55-13]